MAEISLVCLFTSHAASLFQIVTTFLSPEIDFSLFDVICHIIVAYSLPQDSKCGSGRVEWSLREALRALLWTDEHLQHCRGSTLWPVHETF